MEIQISISTHDTNGILEEGMNYINQAAKSKPQWEKHKYNNSYETECDIPENEIMPVLNGLLAKYPGLDISASYSEDIREDDRSAQWWSTTRIKTIHHPDGTATLDFDSSTYWF